MSRLTPFSIGRKWRCEPTYRPPFTFLIIGPGRTPKSKRCRIIDDGRPRSGAPIEQDYTHAHLRKCAKLLPPDGP